MKKNVLSIVSGGSKGMSPAYSPWLKIFSISCSLFGKLGKIVCIGGSKGGPRDACPPVQILSLPPATKLGQGNIFRSVCQKFCPQGGHAWWGWVCMVGVCMAGGHAWQEACKAGGMHGRGHAWQQGHAWQGVHMWHAHPPSIYYEIWSMSGRYTSY